MPYCPNCRRTTQDEANFCPNCGTDLSNAPGAVTNAGPLELPYYISLNRIVLMTVLSYGLYLLYWFYLTWKQYRDYTGDTVYPIWHALTLFVPIYGLFRTHAHAWTFIDLMHDAGVPSTIKAWLVVLLMIIANILSWISVRMSFSVEALSQDTAIGIAFIDAIAIGLTLVILTHLQSNISRYWDSRPNVRVTSARIGVGEVIFGIIGALGWWNTLANIFSESWRLGL